MSTVGERIREARLSRTPRLTLADLAGDRLSISLISKIERGLVQPSLATLEHIAARLDTTVAELVGGAPPAEGPSPTERALALARARTALAADAPDDALALLDPLPSADPAVALLRARALLALGRPDDALATVDSLPQTGESLLLKGEALARRGSHDAAQDAFGRALVRLGPRQPDLRAAALLGLAALSDRTGDRATARNLRQQALSDLAAAANPTRRAAARAADANALAPVRGGASVAAPSALVQPPEPSASDPFEATLAATAAAELSALARAAALRAEVAALLAEAAPAPTGPTPPTTRYLEADDQVRHRSIRSPRPD